MVIMLYAPVAQSVEYRTFNSGVGSFESAQAHQKINKYVCSIDFGYYIHIYFHLYNIYI